MKTRKTILALTTSATDIHEPETANTIIIEEIVETPSKTTTLSTATSTSTTHSSTTHSTTTHSTAETTTTARTTEHSTTITVSDASPKTTKLEQTPIKMQPSIRTELPIETQPEMTTIRKSTNRNLITTQTPFLVYP